VGFNLKEDLRGYLLQEGHEVVDMGNFHFDPADDYPDFIIPCAEKVVSTPDSIGIVIGKSGNGEALASNKVKGIRCALCWNNDMAALARGHNGANMLSLGADFVDLTGAKNIVSVFLNTSFSAEERHHRRVEKIIAYENSHFK
jgi:ribose 5-phosphate isomerase B